MAEEEDEEMATAILSDEDVEEDIEEDEASAAEMVTMKMENEAAEEGSEATGLHTEVEAASVATPSHSL